MTEISIGALLKISLSLVEDGLGDITKKQYEAAIDHIIPSAYDAEDYDFIEYEWKPAGSTKIELTFEGFDHYDYEQNKAYEREQDYIGELLERAYTFACENS